MVSWCSCCFTNQGTLHHLFLDEPIALQVCCHFARQFGMVQLMHSSVSTMFSSWFMSISSRSLDHIQVVVPVAVFWFLWKTRNIARFEVRSSVHGE